MSKRYFINNIDTTWGQAFFNQLVKEVPEQPIHMCTLKNPNQPKPSGIKKVLKRQKPKLSRKKMIEQCDVYVYDVHETDFSDIQFAVNAFTKLPAEQSKVLILVSDIVSWGCTARKVKQAQVAKEEQVVDQGQNAEQKQQAKQNIEQQAKQVQDGIQNQQQIQNDQDVVNKEQVQIQYTYLQQTDYKLRQALPDFHIIKQMQDLFLAYNKDGLKVIVICGGIRYGKGQSIFYQLFKAAWLQHPDALPFLGDGHNLLPTIHINDLVKFVIKVAQNPPQQSKYLLAFDKAQDKSQKALIQSISNVVGSHKVQSVDSSNLISQNSIFRMNINARPSKMLIGTQQQPVQFQWTCQNGLQGQCQIVLNQFCEKHNLRPLKIMMLSQERHITKYDQLLSKLQSHYRIPLITIKNLLDLAVKEANDQLKHDIQDQWQNIQIYINEKKTRGLDQTLKVYYRAIKWRLSQNDCKNRGYILDNFPNFQQQLDIIFKPMGKKLKRKVKKKILSPHKSQPASQLDISKNDDSDNSKIEQPDQAPVVSQQKVQAQAQPQPQPQPQPDQPEQDLGQDDQQKPKTQSFYPQSLIQLKNLSQKKRSNNEINNYFSSKGMQILVFDSSKRDIYQTFESLRLYIQRNECPNNYLLEQGQLVKQYLKHYDDMDLKHKQNLQVQAEKIKQQRKIQLQKRSKLAQDQLEYVLNNQAQLQMTKNIPFRNYLMDFVVPILNEGLLEVSNIIPDDPVEILAQYLFRKSNDV